MTDMAPLIQAIALFITAVAIPMGVFQLRRWNEIRETDQSRAAVYASLQTAAGIIQTKLNQGALRVADISPMNKSILTEAELALARVPDSAASQGTTRDGAAEIIVGRVNTNPIPVVVSGAVLSAAGNAR